MKTKNPVIYPVLFAIYPLLGLYLRFNPLLPFSQAVRSLILVSLFSMLCMLLIKLVVRDWHRAGFLTLILLFLLLYYGTVYELAWSLTIASVNVGRHIVLFPLWLLILVVLGSRWLWKRINNPATLTAFLNLMGGLVILILASRHVISIAQRQPASVQDSFTTFELQDVTFRLKESYRPDIYYIILDGYARRDVLQVLYHLDNSEFLDQLKSRGFYIAEQSQSNYIQTALSLASALNFEYIEGMPADSTDQGALAEPIKHSKLRKLLEEAGYQLVTTYSGYDFTFINDANTVLVPKLGVNFNTFESSLLMRTAAIILVDSGYLKLPVIGHDAFRKTSQYALEQLGEITSIQSPKFIFFHIIAPHPPFVFDRDGNAVSPQALFTINDGSRFPGTLDEYITGYREQVMYVNKMVMKAVDAILAESKEPPVIILQGDHGPGALLNWESAQESCLWERVSILNAYYLPGNGKDRLYSTITPVNSFRVIFDTLFGTQLGLLEDKSYYSPWGRPFAFEELGENSQIQCELP